jgi:hypothetical protein
MCHSMRLIWCLDTWYLHFGLFWPPKMDIFQEKTCTKSTFWKMRVRLFWNQSNDIVWPKSTYNVFFFIKKYLYSLILRPLITCCCVIEALPLLTKIGKIARLVIFKFFLWCHSFCHSWSHSFYPQFSTRATISLPTSDPHAKQERFCLSWCDTPTPFDSYSWLKIRSLLFFLLGRKMRSTHSIILSRHLSFYDVCAFYCVVHKWCHRRWKRGVIRER